MPNPGDFLRTLLALSAAYMGRYNYWQQNFMPQVFRGMTPEFERDLRVPYDFVIVGSGYAGSLVASRLARTGCYKVLLLEAGSIPEFESTIPFIQPYDYSNTTWGYDTVSQRYASRGMKDYVTKLWNGKALGGTSILESGVYLPENPNDFARWARQYGLSEWDLDEISPFFFKVSTDTNSSGSALDPSLDENADDVLNAIRKGDLENASKTMKKSNKTDARNGNPISYLWTMAGMAMGYPINNGISPDLYKKGGFFVPNVMSSRGMRMTPVSQFLGDVSPRNLFVATGVEVEKIDFNGLRRVAREVVFRDVKTGQKYTARVSREVILAAGAIGSAKILIQSGIGPADHLNELKIPVTQHLPVGVQLRDRVSATLFIKMGELFTDSLRRKLMDMEEVYHYMVNGTGFLASTNMFGAAVLKTEPLYEPDLKLEMKPIGLMGFESVTEGMNYKQEVLDMLDVGGSLKENGGLAVTMTVLNPFSVGTMWLRPKSANASSGFMPVINPSYLQDDRDLVTMVKAAEFIEEMSKTSYMQLLNAELVKPVFPGCPAPETTSSEAYWRCALVHLATSGRHLTGTNQILHTVDMDLKVRGVEGVRVIDESVFPEPVTGGFAASIMAVANKGAQYVLNDNQSGCLAGRRKV